MESNKRKAEELETEEEEIVEVAKKARVEKKKKKSSKKKSKKKKSKKRSKERKAASSDGDITAAQDGIDSKEEKNVHANGIPYTVTIALPGSIIANAQSRELRTYLAGQIARAATIYNITEVVVFSETGEEANMAGKFKGAHRGSDPNVFLARILQYLETPQYLRKALFPVHPDLKFAGLLNPLDAIHHVRADKDSKYREGVVVNRPTKAKDNGCWVNVGLRKNCLIDKKLRPGVRVTVEIDDPKGSSDSQFGGSTRNSLTGIAVAPSAPRVKDGLGWGYMTRLAAGISKVWSECPYKTGYDLSIGTSDTGVDAQLDDFELPPFRHLLILFGGLGGLESAIEGDDHLAATRPKELFDMYINCCPDQGSRTIRTEEAIPIAMSVLAPHIKKNVMPK